MHPMLAAGLRATHFRRRSYHGRRADLPAVRFASAPDVPGGVCPACLLRAGLGRGASPVDQRASSTASASQSSLSPGALETLAGSFGPVPRIMLRDTDDGYEGPVVKPARPEVLDGPGRYRGWRRFRALRRRGRARVCPQGRANGAEKPKSRQHTRSGRVPVGPPGPIDRRK